MRILYGAAGALLGRDEAITDGLIVEIKGDPPSEHRLEIGRAGDRRRARLVPVAPSVSGAAAGGLAARGRPG